MNVTSKNKLPHATLHLAITADGSPVLMDDQGRMIAGVQMLEIEAPMNDMVKVRVAMIAGVPPS